MGNLKSGVRREDAGQQAALEGDRHVVLAGETARVVDGYTRAGRQFLGEGQVLGLEGLLVHAPEVDRTQHHSPRLQRNGDQGVDPVVQYRTGP